VRLQQNLLPETAPQPVDWRLGRPQYLNPQAEPGFEQGQQAGCLGGTVPGGPFGGAGKLDGRQKAEGRIPQLLAELQFLVAKAFKSWVRARATA